MVPISFNVRGRNDSHSESHAGRRPHRNRSRSASGISLAETDEPCRRVSLRNCHVGLHGDRDELRGLPTRCHAHSGNGVVPGPVVHYRAHPPYVGPVGVFVHIDRPWLETTIRSRIARCWMADPRQCCRGDVRRPFGHVRIVISFGSRAVVVRCRARVRSDGARRATRVVERASRHAAGSRLGDCAPGCDCLRTFSVWPGVQGLFPPGRISVHVGRGGDSGNQRSHD